MSDDAEKTVFDDLGDDEGVLCFDGGSACARDVYHTRLCETARRTENHKVISQRVITARSITHCERCDESTTVEQDTHGTMTCPMCEETVGKLPTHIRHCDDGPPPADERDTDDSPSRRYVP